MKKVLFILFMALMLLTSCENNLTYLDTAPVADTVAPGEYTYTESDDGVLPYNPLNGGEYLKYRDGSLYFFSTAKSSYGISILMRLNVKTGNITSVCADPLCQHDSSDCPFYGVNTFWILTPDGNIRYFRNYIESIKDAYGVTAGVVINVSFCTFDTRASQMTVNEEFDPNEGWSGGNEFYSGDYRFYQSSRYDEETDSYVSSNLRMDMTTNKKTVVTENPDTMLFIIGERLYLTDSAVIYSVDFDGGDRVDCVTGRFARRQILTDGEYVYYKADGELCRMSLSGGDEEPLGVYPNESYNYYLTENYIYYISGDEVVLGKAKIRGYASDIVTLEGGEFWRCAYDGSNNELVYKFEGDTAGFRPLYTTVAGNYIYCMYTWWTDADSDGVYVDGDNGYSFPVNGSTACTIMRIDVTTGEAYFIKAAE